jgi:hypothetical protein
VAAAVVVFGFAVAITVVRGGNDAYEVFSTGDLDAVNFTYDHAEYGQTIGMVVPYLPIGQRDVGAIGVFVVSGGSAAPSLSDDRLTLLLVRPKWVILSQSEEAWGEIIAGYPKGWEALLEESSLQKGCHIAAQCRTATVLKTGQVTPS